MKVSTSITTPDYREAMQLFSLHRSQGSKVTCNTIADNTFDYTVTWYTECNSTPSLMRQLIANIYHGHSDLPLEELDALVYAEQAIKTLEDMGVLK